MPKIHVFGDSFARDWNLPWQWHRQLGAISNRDVNIIAEFGVSNDWIGMKFADELICGSFEEGDVVIAVTTSCSRYWFLEDHPTISNFLNLTEFEGYKNKYGVSDEQVKAIELYYKHIHQGRVDAFRFDSQVAWWNHQSRVLDGMGVKLCVIPGWDHTSLVKFDSRIPVMGNLVDHVSSTEFTSERAMEEWYNRPLPDQRVNHMLMDNHYELARALAQSITEDRPLDLINTPWRKGVLNVRTQKMFAAQLSPVPIK